MTIIIDNHVSFVDGAQQVMEITHDLLIGADQEKRYVIRLTVCALKRMYLQNLLDVLEVNEFIDNAVRIAGYISQRCIFCRSFIELVNRHNWKQLINSPMIRQR